MASLTACWIWHPAAEPAHRNRVNRYLAPAPCTAATPAALRKRPVNPTLRESE